MNEYASHRRHILSFIKVTPMRIEIIFEKPLKLNYANMSVFENRQILMPRMLSFFLLYNVVDSLRLTG